MQPNGNETVSVTTFLPANKKNTTTVERAITHSTSKTIVWLSRRQKLVANSVTLRSDKIGDRSQTTNNETHLLISQKHSFSYIEGRYTKFTIVSKETETTAQHSCPDILISRHNSIGTGYGLSISWTDNQQLGMKTVQTILLFRTQILLVTQWKQGFQITKPYLSRRTIIYSTSWS